MEAQETEQLCPYCKRVHYSIYTSERCAARHQVSGELTSYLNEERQKKTKQMSPQTGKKSGRPEPFN
jgi:hypothetical protein